MLHKLLLAEDIFEPILYLTGQHKEIVDEVLEVFNIEDCFKANFDTENSKIAFKTSQIISELQNKIDKCNPELIIVQGDTLSSFCGSYVSYLNKIKLVHIEAGLRTNDKWSPFPEEIFRQFNDKLADLHFAPTQSALDNLVKEGIDKSSVYITGNTGIDALMYVVDAIDNDRLRPSKKVSQFLDAIKQNKNKAILLTLHRRENQEYFIEKILKQLDEIVKDNNINVILPIHPNPIIKSKIDQLKLNEKIIMTSSFNYVDFVYLMNSSELILTDSGGIQEEAPYLGKPIIVLREKTERSEILQSSRCKIYNEESFENDIKILLNSESEPSQMFGDGKASYKIIEVLKMQKWY